MQRRAIAAFAALTVACSLTSLDGLSGGATSTTPGAEAGGTTDATADALVGSEAGSDGAPAGIASCASAPAGAFCDDFEDGLSRWDRGISTGESFDIDQVSSISPTHSALATVSTGGSCCLSRSLPDNSVSIDVDADVRFESLSGGSTEFDFLGLRGQPDHNITLQVRLGTIEHDEDIVPIAGGADEKLTSTGYAVDSAWHHVHWTHRLTGATASVEVFIDGKKIGAVATDILDYAAPLTLDVGDCATDADGSPWKVRFDNIVVVTK